ncbi:MAG: hypothetical protein Q8L37_03025 [Candidatus Gottesmanbacteria bacterium]|nr:hypothetical protein [Candidatus Gottesmanbacteria bacterium]
MTETMDRPVMTPERAEKKNFAERFFERWNTELKKVSDGINEADREARLKLQTLNADVLRRAGLKETAYGIALTSLSTATAGFGAGLGALGGAVGGGLAGGVIGGLAGLAGFSSTGPGAIPASVLGFGAGLYTGFIGGGLAGSAAGYYAGVELSGWVYSKFIRKMDTELQPLAKIDWFLGQVPGLNPPIVGGLRNMFEGFFGLAAKREEAAAAISK